MRSRMRRACHPAPSWVEQDPLELLATVEACVTAVVADLARDGVPLSRSALTSDYCQ